MNKEQKCISKELSIEEIQDWLMIFSRDGWIKFNEYIYYKINYDGENESPSESTGTFGDISSG